VLFHAITAAHVRRTNVTFAVALQCEAALAHGVSDLHTSMFARKSRLSEPGTPGSQHGSPGSPHGGSTADDEAEAAATFAFRGRRFAAPGLAAAAASFFSGDPLHPTIVRPLLRSPLLAALGGHKGQDPTTLTTRRKPKGPWKRFKRALHAELAWHRRAWNHAARSIKRCLTPRLRADKRAAGRGVGHAFRIVPAGEWLGEAAPPTAALFEVCVQFGWRGRVAAAAFRDRLRDEEHLRALEDGFAACVAAAEAAHDIDEHDGPPAKHAQQPSLGVRHAGIAVVALLDDEPFARLDAHLTRKLGGPRAEAAAPPKTHELGLSPPVAERLATMLLLSMKRKDPASRRSSWFGPRRSQAETPQPTGFSGDAATRGDELIASLAAGPSALEDSPPTQPVLDTVAADVDTWHLSPRAFNAEASELAAEAEAEAEATSEADAHVEAEAADPEADEASARAADEEAPEESSQPGDEPAEPAPEQAEGADRSLHSEPEDEPSPEVELASHREDEDDRSE